jgi:MFS family permease
VSALRTRSFWTIALPFCLAFIANGGFLVHQLTFLQPALGQTQAAFTVSATMFASLVGRLVIGLLSDYLDRRLLSAGCVTTHGLALALMAALPSPSTLLLGSMALGLGAGMMITLPPLVIQEEFGTASFGTVFAMVNGAMQGGVALGPTIVGVLRDRWGGYEGALYVLVAIEATAVVVVLSGRGLRKIWSPGT